MLASNHSVNILLLVFDDLRPWFLPFSDSGIAAPSLAGLAGSSLTFNNTYVQQAVCGPSRNSFMSGRRPSSTRTWNFKTSFRESGVDTHGVPGSSWSTLPQAFKEAGYVTIGMGKLFHPGSPKSNDCHDRNDNHRCWNSLFADAAQRWWRNVRLLTTAGLRMSVAQLDLKHPPAHVLPRSPTATNIGVYSGRDMMSCCAFF